MKKTARSLPGPAIRTILQTSLFCLAVTLSGCLGDFTSPAGSDEPPPPNLPAVQADGVLETVTWNIEWYGSPSNGPDDEDLQTENVLAVMGSLEADLYALQEIFSREALDRLTGRMEGYRGFAARHIEWIQKTAFIYNSATIDSVSSGAISQGQSEFDWANGRLPLFFSFIYSFEDRKIPVCAIVIHAKANTGSESEKIEAYNRRRRAADNLYHQLREARPETNIILLGDFNDDLDIAIHDGSSDSPYDIFTEEGSGFIPITKTISATGASSLPEGNFTDLIDHIIISNEMNRWYLNTSEEIYNRAEQIIPDYTTTTSDHLPVWARFDITISN